MSSLTPRMKYSRDGSALVRCHPLCSEFQIWMCLNLIYRLGHSSGQQMEDYYHRPIFQSPPSTLTTIWRWTSCILPKFQHDICMLTASSTSWLLHSITLVICTSILVLLTGVAMTFSLLGLIFFTPLLVVFSPVWIPALSAVFVLISGLLLACVFPVVAIGVVTWAYKHFGRSNADRRIFYTVREYTKVKDAAPSAWMLLFSDKDEVRLKYVWFFITVHNCPYL